MSGKTDQITEANRQSVVSCGCAALALSCREPKIVLAPSSPRMLINPITSHASPESLSLFEIGKRLIRCKRPQ